MANTTATNRTLWAGNLYGTNTANLFAEFETTDGKIVGKIRVMDRLHGLVVYAVKGTAGELFEFTGTPQGVPEDQVENYGEISAKASLTSEGILRGEWNSTVGTAGTFELHPHGSGVSPSGSRSTTSLPEQIVTRNAQIGAVRLYREDIDRIIKKMRTDFSKGLPVVTFNDGHSEYAKYVDQFLEHVEQSNPLKYLKIQIQEPDAHGINKVAVVELNANSINEIRVQGVNESWVHGLCDVLQNELRSAESNLVTNYRKLGLTFTQIVLLTVLVVLPEFSDWLQRAIFLLVVSVLLAGINKAHSSFIPTALIHVSSKPPSLWVRTRPAFFSWVIAASATAAGSLAFWALQVFLS